MDDRDQADTGALALTAIQERLLATGAGRDTDTARAGVRAADVALKACAHLARARRRRARARFVDAQKALVRSLERYLLLAFGSFLSPASASRISRRAADEYIAPLYAHRVTHPMDVETLLSDADNEAVRQRECMLASSCSARDTCMHGHSCAPGWLIGSTAVEARDHHVVRRAFGSETTLDAVREGLKVLRARKPKHPAQRLQYLAVVHYLDRLEREDNELVGFSWSELAEELRDRESHYRLGPVTSQTVQAAFEEFTKTLIALPSDVRA